MDTKTVINIVVNDTHLKLDSDAVTGAELKQLANVPAANLLFRDLPGQQEDPAVTDTETITVKSGDRFYDMPQGNFG